MKRHIVLILIALCFIGCSSLTDKGDKLFEQGDYQAAADYYERALRKDRDNVDAQLGLGRARNKIIDRGLIEVRMLRLSSNMSGATQKLETILRNQLDWNIQLQGAVAVTQAEETRYAKQWLSKQARAIATSDLPDEYRWFEYQYAQLITNTQLNLALADQERKIIVQGKSKCRALAKDIKGQRFFLKRFAEKYCAAWKQPMSFKVDAVDRSRFDRLTTTNKVRHYSDYDSDQHEDMMDQLNSLRESFRETVWWSPIARESLNVEARGKVDYFRDSNRQRRRASYNVNESVKSRGENGEETTKTVSVKRTHAYTVRVYDESLEMNVTYRSYLRDQDIVKRLNDVETNQTESHREHFPDANLSPLDPEFMQLSSVFNPAVSQLNRDFLDALDDLWVQEYCNSDQNEPSGEHVMRCAELRPTDDYVNSWFRQHFGIDYQQMTELYRF